MALFETHPLIRWVERDGRYVLQYLVEYTQHDPVKTWTEWQDVPVKDPDNPGVYKYPFGGPYHDPDRNPAVEQLNAQTPDPSVDKVHHGTSVLTEKPADGGFLGPDEDVKEFLEDMIKKQAADIEALKKDLAAKNRELDDYRSGVHTIKRFLAGVKPL